MFSSIADISPEDRPRERLFNLGPDSLSDRDLVAVLLGSGGPGRSVFQVAEEVLKSGFDDPAKLFATSGVGRAKAASLLAGLELGRRMSGPSRPHLDTPDAAAELLWEAAELDREHFFVVCLDARRRLLCKETISIGTLTASLVHPREVFLPAIQARAASILVAHNHPSGDPEPSAEDIALTHRLNRASQVLGIPLLDHLIIGRDGFVSLAEMGELDPEW